MKHSKKILLTGATLAIIGGTLLTTNQVFAQTATTDSVQTDPMSTLVQKIADKFGLNKDEVQAVFDQDRAEMKAKMQTNYEARLTQLVTDGEITEAQKQLIIQKNQELQANMETEMDNFKTMTDEQRKAAMEARRTELESWASANGIDPKYLMFKAHFKGHGGPGMRGDRVMFTQPAN